MQSKFQLEQECFQVQATRHLLFLSVLKTHLEIVMHYLKEKVVQWT